MIISHYIALGIVFALSALAITFRKQSWARQAAVLACFGFNAFFLAAYLFLGMRFALNEGIKDDAAPSADFVAGVTAGINQGVGISVYLFISSIALGLLLMRPRVPREDTANQNAQISRPTSGAPER